MDAFLPDFVNDAINHGLSFIYSFEPLVAPTVVLGRYRISHCPQDISLYLTFGYVAQKRSSILCERPC